MPNFNIQSSKAVVTPTFSRDRSTLSEQLQGSNAIGYEQAKQVASEWDVVRCRTFLHRQKLDTNEDWISLYESCNSIEHSGDGSITINMEKVLKKCYEIAFAMPPSPNSTFREQPKMSNSLVPPTLSI